MSTRPHPYHLDKPGFDVILLGTSLTNSILASALSQAGKTVLHVDRNSVYGGNMFSFRLNDFTSWIDLMPVDSTLAAVAPPISVETKTAFQHTWKQAQAQEANTEAASAAVVYTYDKDLGKVLADEAEVKANGGKRKPKDWSKFDAVGPSFPGPEFEPFFGGQYYYTPPRETPKQPEPEPEPEPEAVSTEVVAAAEQTPKDAVAADAEAEVAAVEVVQPPPVVEVKTKKASLPTPQEYLTKLNKRFWFDTNPYLIYSKSELLKLLINSDCCRYMEFRAVDDYWHAFKTLGMVRVPLSKSDIFQSKFLSQIDKWSLTRLTQSLLGQRRGGDNSGGIALEKTSVDIDVKNLPTLFKEYLSSTAKLSPHLQQLMMYCLVLVDSETDADTCTTETGITIMKFFFSCIGKFTRGAFIVPEYGMSEVPQAFTRLASVNGAVYMLNFRPCGMVFTPSPVQDAAAKEEQTWQAKAVISEARQELTAAHFVLDADYIPPSLLPAVASCPHAFKVYSRAVLITTHPLGMHNNNDCGLFTVSPGVASKNSARVIQYGASLSTCPRGTSTSYIISQSTGVSATAAEDLKELVHYLVEQSNQYLPEGVTNRLLFVGFYSQRCRTLSKTDLPTDSAFAQASNVHLMPDMPPFGPFELTNCSQLAEKCFRKIMGPDVEFMPKILKEGEKPLGGVSGRERRENRIENDFNALDEEDLDALLDDLDLDDEDL